MLKCDFNRVARCSFGNLLHLFSKHLFLAKFCNDAFLFVVSCDLELDHIKVIGNMFFIAVSRDVRRRAEVGIYG